MRNSKKPWHVGGGGATNLTRIEVQRFCQRLLNDPKYLQALEDRLISGKLAPAMEIALWAYAFGRPIDKVEMNVTHTSNSLADRTTDELLADLRTLITNVEENEEQRKQLEAELKALEELKKQSVH